MTASDAVLDLGVKKHPLGFKIDINHLARAKPALCPDIRGGNIEHARLRGQHDKIVFCNRVAGGAQAVAVKHGANGFAIGKGQGGRAVPRLHQTGVIFVEIF